MNFLLLGIYHTTACLKSVVLNQKPLDARVQNVQAVQIVQTVLENMIRSGESARFGVILTRDPRLRTPDRKSPT